MNTNAEDRDINQVNRTIAEFLGTHLFEEVQVERKFGFKVWVCKHCEIPRFGHPDDPDYTSSLDAVAEAEKKAVIEFGRSEYYGRLEYQVGVDDLFAKYWVVTATALQRATAIVCLIQEVEK